MIDGFITERLIYKDQLAPIAKVDADGNVLEEYIYGTGINSPDYIRKDGVNYRVIKDLLGSVRMIDNASTGEIVKEIEYDEFGNITAETGTYSIPFGFAGGLQDRDTGLIHFGARWYDPETGRWISKEPLGFEGAMNFYSYCDGDPVNKVDVTGLKLVLVGTATDKAFITLALAKLEFYSPTAKQLIKLLEDTDYVYKIALTSDSNEHKRLKKLIYYNPFKTHLRDGSERWHYRPPEIGLAHELFCCL